METHIVTLAKSVMQLSVEVSQMHRLLERQPTSEDKPKSTANNIHPSLRYLRTPRSLRKLQWFFGQQPPLVKDFLDDLGYSHLTAVLEQQQINLLELSCLSEDQLENLGIPLGPRSRILKVNVCKTV